MGGFAWVTLATNDSYSLGALVLAHSLKQAGTKQQLVVLVTPGVTLPMREKLASVFNVVQEVNILDSKDETNLRLLKRPELGITFTKLHCWRLTQFDKCVFLDADTLVLQNCDELFEREELSAAPDVGWPDCFNSGVFVFKPSSDTYEKLVSFALEKGSFDGGDQGLLNLFFSDWAHKDISKHLPFIYNMCSTACYSYLPAFKQFGQNAKIVHFIGATKPWLQYFDSESKKVHPSADSTHLSPALQRWWDIFCNYVHCRLTPDMAGLAGAFAQLTLGAPRSTEQTALEDHLRRQSWEVGNIDYMGRDSFDNIWRRISQTLSSPPLEATPETTEVSTEVTSPVARPTEEPPVEATKVQEPELESAKPLEVIDKNEETRSLSEKCAQAVLCEELTEKLTSELTEILQPPPEKVPQLVQNVENLQQLPESEQPILKQDSIESPKADVVMEPIPLPSPKEEKLELGFTIVEKEQTLELATTQEAIVPPKEEITTPTDVLIAPQEVPLAEAPISPKEESTPILPQEVCNLPKEIQPSEAPQEVPLTKLEPLVSQEVMEPPSAPLETKEPLVCPIKMQEPQATPTKEPLVCPMPSKEKPLVCPMPLKEEPLVCPMSPKEEMVAPTTEEPLVPQEAKEPKSPETPKEEPICPLVPQEATQEPTKEPLKEEPLVAQEPVIEATKEEPSCPLVPQEPQASGVPGTPTEIPSSPISEVPEVVKDPEALGVEPVVLQTPPPPQAGVPTPTPPPRKSSGGGKKSKSKK